MERRTFLQAAGTGLVATGFGLRSAAADAQVTVLRNVDVLLDPIRKTHDLPALAGAIVTTKGAVAVGAVGVRKYGANNPVTHQDRFHLGSCTKSMTATLIGLLVQEGKLSWGTTLEKAFPNLKESLHPKLRPVTIEHLLCHRSGLSAENWLPGKNFLQMHQLPGTPRQQRETYAAGVLREAPAYEPGSRYVYTNRGFAVAGAIAERVTDTAWEELMVQRLFKPLGMSSVGYGAMGTPGKMDQPWQHRWNGNTRVPIEPGPTADNPPAIGPAGIAHCTVGDWAKYVALHLEPAQGRGALLSPKTLAHLHTVPAFGGNYAFGWTVLQRDWGGGKVLTHSGSNNQNYAVVWMAPLNDFAVLAMTNQGGNAAEKACDDVASTLIGEHLKG